ncbi:MAG: hypothetical protein JEY79_15400 [Pseudodesulfovibrio sp.]|nr:hypothetical protein [Pseudodesulfovibrio sp.]
MKIQLAIIFLTLTALTGCMGNVSTKTMQQPTAFVTLKSTNPTSESNHIGPLELQAAVMSFSDTTNSRLSEAASIIERIGTPQARLTAARMLVFDLSSNVEIAAGPYPGIALLDMTVITSLRRMVWEDFWIPKVFGEQAAPALDVLKQSEKDIWNIAARIMTQDQLDELARVIIQWRKNNPNQVSVNFVRFDDFGDLGLKPSMRKLIVPGGLFASVREATRVAQDMKVTIDRAFYLMSRMQLVMNFQVKLAYLEMMFQPEAEGIVDTSKRMVGLTERYAEIAENLPEKMSKEATEILEMLFKQLAKNRDETITNVLAGLSQWQDQTIRDVMVNVSAERQATLDQALAGVIQQQNDLYKQLDIIVDKSGNEFKQTLNHAFILGVLFILVFFALLAMYKVFVIKRLENGQRPQ